MRYIFTLLFLVILLFKIVAQPTSVNEVTENYEIYKAKEQRALLILFPCYPCDAAHTQHAFDIKEKALNAGISILYMNFNQHLFLQNSEKKFLTQIINSAIDNHLLNSENIYLGGFSGGGNVSTLLSNYLLKVNNKYTPKGVFIVDSPIDLVALYQTAKKHENTNTKISAEENQMIISSLDKAFGQLKPNYSNYKPYSPYISKIDNIDNSSYLKDMKIRLYTEPDIKWWKENRNQEYEDMNAYYIKKYAEALKSAGANKVEYIPTKNKGYRPDGTRHPHSWAIVDQTDLIDWILN